MIMVSQLQYIIRNTPLLFKQKSINASLNYKVGDLPVAEQAAKEDFLKLPMSAFLSIEQQSFIASFL